MSEEDLKAILSKYQQKSFDLYNKNLVLETQVETLTNTVSKLNLELEKLKKTKRTSKSTEDFQ